MTLSNLKRFFLLCTPAILQLSAFAYDITVGRTKISIPTPSGYAPVTNQMQPYAAAAALNVAPGNQQFALFLPTRDAGVAASGGMPVRGRRYSVQVPKDAVPHTISERFFAEYKDAIKNRMPNIQESIRDSLPGMLNSAITDAYKSLEVEAPRVLSTRVTWAPVHYESPKCIAVSGLTQWVYQSNTGSVSIIEGSSTMTSVHIRGKLLLLFVSGEKDDLEWTREVSKKWVNNAFASNRESDVLSGKGEGDIEVVRQVVKYGAQVIGYIFVGIVVGLMMIVWRIISGQGRKAVSSEAEDASHHDVK